MSVYRTKKVSNFTVVDNILIDDKELNIEEKGLMLILLRLPESWDFSAKGLSALTGKSKDTTNKILQSLEKKHYLFRKKYFANGKIAGNYYYVFEDKKLYEQFTKKQDIEKQDIEKQDIVIWDNKQILSKTNTILNNNKINKKENIKRKKYFEDIELNELFIDFLEIRKKLKAVNSDRAINTLLNILNKYDDITKKEMINNSIVNSWKSIYEVNDNKKKEKNFVKKKEEIVYEIV